MSDNAKPPKTIALGLPGLYEIALSLHQLPAAPGASPYVLPTASPARVVLSRSLSIHCWVTWYLTLRLQFYFYSLFSFVISARLVIHISDTTYHSVHLVDRLISRHLQLKTDTAPI